MHILSLYLQGYQECAHGDEGQNVERIRDGEVSEPQEAARLHTVHGQVGHCPYADEHGDEDRHLKTRKPTSFSI